MKNQISILIPVYNFDVTSLALRLKEEIDFLNVDYEMIFLDDCSSEISIMLKNQKFLTSLGLIYKISDVNEGIACTLNKLVKFSKYENLIFIDADVFPIKDDFLSCYIKRLEYEAVFCGGLIYDEISPENGTLRWKYGRKYEVQTIELARKNPYLNFKTCNFLIKKSVFEKIKFESENNKYSAVDTLFGFRLKEADIKVEFIENRVKHLGLETNQIFLDKTELAVKSMWKMYNTHTFFKSRLIDFFLILERFYLIYLVSFILTLIKDRVKENLLSSNPSVFLFQLYKLKIVIELQKAKHS